MAIEQVFAIKVSNEDDTKFAFIHHKLDPHGGTFIVDGKYMAPSENSYRLYFEHTSDVYDFLRITFPNYMTKYSFIYYDKLVGFDLDALHDEYHCIETNEDLSKKNIKRLIRMIRTIDGNGV